MEAATADFGISPRAQSGVIAARPILDIVPALFAGKRPVAHLVARVSGLRRGLVECRVQVRRAVVVGRKLTAPHHICKRSAFAYGKHICGQVLRAQRAHYRGKLAHIRFRLVRHAQHNIRAHAEAATRRASYRLFRLLSAVYSAECGQRFIGKRLHAQRNSVHAQRLQLLRLFVGKRFGIALAGKLRPFRYTDMLFYHC